MAGGSSSRPDTLKQTDLRRSQKPTCRRGGPYVAFVTGGGRTSDSAAAETLLEAGARVLISDIDPSLLEDAKAKLSGKGAVDTLFLDISASPAVAAAAKAADERHGGVDILIANAGIAWPDTPGEALSDDVWRKVIDIDLDGAYWSCREFGRAMPKRWRGSIVTVGSMSCVISNKPQR